MDSTQSIRKYYSNFSSPRALSVIMCRALIRGLLDQKKKGDLFLYNQKYNPVESFAQVDPRAQSFSFKEIKNIYLLQLFLLFLLCGIASTAAQIARLVGWITSDLFFFLKSRLGWIMQKNFPKTPLPPSLYTKLENFVRSEQSSLCFQIPITLCRIKSYHHILHLLLMVISGDHKLYSQ